MAGQLVDRSEAGVAEESLLFGVSRHDPRALLGAAAILGLVAVIASYLPARRATLVDPLEALRAD